MVYHDGGDNEGDKYLGVELLSVFSMCTGRLRMGELRMDVKTL